MTAAETLFHAHTEWALGLARRRRGLGDQDDIRAAALRGLFMAARTADPSRNFRTYAYMRVVGEMLNESHFDSQITHQPLTDTISSGATDVAAVVAARDTASYLLRFVPCKYRHMMRRLLVGTSDVDDEAARLGISYQATWQIRDRCLRLMRAKAIRMGLAVA